MSLDRIEALAARLWPHGRHAAVFIADRRKSGRIVLLTTARDADREALRQEVNRSGLSERTAPAEIVRVEELPQTKAGMIDYAQAGEIARSHARRAKAA